MKAQNIIMTAISLIIIALIMPMAIGLLAGAGGTQITINGVNTTLAAVADPMIVILLSVLLPALAIIGLVMYFVPRTKG